MKGFHDLAHGVCVLSCVVHGDLACSLNMLLTSLELGVVAGEGDIADAGEGHVGTVSQMDGTLEGGTSGAGEGETGSGGRTRHTAMPPTEASIPTTETDCTPAFQ